MSMADFRNYIKVISLLNSSLLKRLSIELKELH
jgi:hypothetical protein